MTILTGIGVFILGFMIGLVFGWITCYFFLWVLLLWTGAVRG